MTSNASQKFRMTVDLNVLDHLADGLYSSVAAVLTEAVANAWDADAETVKIDFDIAKDYIHIIDDGIGMNEVGVNERYLRVGYRRRDDGDTSPGSRPVMGRKGIGKLSLFSIADRIEVRTMAESEKPAGLVISTPDLRKAMEKKSPEYNPTPVTVKSSEFSVGHGTKIFVSKLKKQRLRDMAPESLRRRLARRFSVIGSLDFRVYVNGTEVTSNDRDDLKFVEYLWKFNGTNLDTSVCGNLKNEQSVDNRMESWDDTWGVKGWIGTVDLPKRLSTHEGNLNSIVVLSRGRLVDEDVLPRIVGAEFYTKYLTGQVEADFLDDSQSDDIVTSNRQRIIEDDKRFLAVIEFLKMQMRKIAETWSGLRTTDKTSELRKRYPRIGDWLDTLKDGWKTKAEKLMERIATMEVSRDDEDREETQRTLLRHAIFGFERLRLRGNAEELERALHEGVDSLLRLLADRDSLEASLYLDIVKNRLEAINELHQLVEEDQIERVLQKYLFEHLWLLDTAWERATDSPEMENRLRLRKPFKDDDETKERYGRIDIRYKTIIGKHVIVELKRASVRPRIYELANQGADYVDAVKEVLLPEERDQAQIEVIFVVGKNPPESSQRIKDAMNSVSPGSGIRTYEQLIVRAQQAYAAYSDRLGDVDKIDKLFKDEGTAL